MSPNTSLLKSKLFWVGILYFAEGFPLGLFYDVFPVQLRQQGVDLREIGSLSLLGLAWTVKFLWAPAIDHYRHHRRWMFAADVGMGMALIFMATQSGLGDATRLAIAIFTLLSATNDIATDGYTIEQLDRAELGLANGIRIGMYRVGMLSTSFILILSDVLGWGGSYVIAAAVLVILGLIILRAPREKPAGATRKVTLAREWKNIVFRPQAFGIVLMFALGTLWLVNSSTLWSATIANFWWYALGVAGLALTVSIVLDSHGNRHDRNQDTRLADGPMFGALMEMIQRPMMVPIILFVLLFKLGDAAMGFMIKPFWVDSGFTATQIGLVSVNIGLLLSILGGIAGGWFTDRVGIFHALWILGLTQAVSNLGYVWAAGVIPQAVDAIPTLDQKMVMYTASALESFTGGLGTAAFMAFMMAIVDRKHSATEYALLSSIFALTRHLSGYASGFGAHYMGYAPYFLLTFALSFPAYALLPWIRKAIDVNTKTGND